MRRALAWGGTAVVLAAASVTAYWSLAPPSRTCASCHEIAPAHAAWEASTHRDVPCAGCHGGVFSGGLHGMTENLRRAVGHFEATDPDAIRLSENQVLALQERCRSCHASAYAGWVAGGHSLAYADVFLDPAHNRLQPPHEDCLRCHGMYFDGAFSSLLAPGETDGTWSFRVAGQAERPAIPCLACHQVHTEGAPADRPDYAHPEAIAANRPAPARGVGLYDRDESLFFPVDVLPELRLADADSPVPVAPDPLVRLCVQCHAPDAAHSAGSSDDRTPRGVHAGLSCTACHQVHSQDARGSCATCHPALSNCGLDVETMDTSFRSVESLHDIHVVACADCHPDGRTGPLRDFR